MIDFFSTTGYEDGQVWVSGQFDEDGEFIVNAVYPRTGPSVDIRPFLTLQQIEAFKGPAWRALKAQADEAAFDRAEDRYQDALAA